MNPISLDLTKLRAAAALLVLGILLVAAAGAGWAVNGWRLAGPHERELAAQDKRISDLEQAIAVQNAQIEAASAATVAANDRRKQAEAVAARVVDRLGARGAAVTASTATDCAGVLRESWGAWK